MASNHYFLELEPPAERLHHAPHVVIGLIEKRNFNLSHPLLYQVATVVVLRSDVATPLASARTGGQAKQRAGGSPP